jgi:hypothetical protein
LTKITYQPCQEIVIHELLEFDNERFFKEALSQTALQQMTQQQYVPIVVTWVDGVTFLGIPFPDTEMVMADKLLGKTHYMVVLFTKMPYKETYSTRVRTETMTIEIEKGEDNPLFVELAEFLKNFH